MHAFAHLRFGLTRSIPTIFPQDKLRTAEEVMKTLEKKSSLTDRSLPVGAHGLG